MEKELKKKVRRELISSSPSLIIFTAFLIYDAAVQDWRAFWIILGIMLTMISLVAILSWWDWKKRK